MNKIPLPDGLPWQIHMMFWIMFIFISIGLSISVWFLVRLVKQQDTINETLKNSVDGVKTDIAILKKVALEDLRLVRSDVADFRKSALDTREATLNDFNQIKNDVYESKKIIKIVETHHTVLKTLVIKINELMILKTKKD